MLGTLDARIGFAGGTAHQTIDTVRADVAWASAAGFDSYWLSHVFGVDPLIALAAAAPAGPALRELGTSVMAMPGRHPIALAQQARTTQQACAGRFTLGMGPSHQVVVEGIYGDDWSRPATRTAEYLEALVPLCAGEAASVDGSQVTAHATLNVPCDPVPVVLAALGPRMLDIAGRHTAGTHLGNCGPHTIRTHIAPRLNDAAAAAGRPTPRIIALVGVAVTNDVEAARAASREAGAGYAALPSYRAMLDREGVSSPADLLQAGSVDQVLEGLASYVEAGVTDLRIAALGQDDATVHATRSALADALT